MFGKKNRVSPEGPEKFTLYLPKKYRVSALLSDLPYDLEQIKKTQPKIYKSLISKLVKEFNKDKNIIFVDIYKNNIVFFDCIKLIPFVKQQCFDKKDLNVCIKKIVIADIDTIQANPYEDELMHNPCTPTELHAEYPSTYTFDNPI